MLDLNDLRVFEKVASLRSFSAAARVLRVPKSSVSRSIKRLETELAVRLLQRTTRDVALTEVGETLRAQCADLLDRIQDTIGSVSAQGAVPRGRLRISASNAVGLNVLSEQLPRFLALYPGVSIDLELTTRLSDIIAEGFDVAIRMGPLRDSALIATRLGTIAHDLCAAPTYLERHGAPRNLEALRQHDIVERPSVDGRLRIWTFLNESGETFSLEKRPRLCVNDPNTIQRLVLNGAGFGCLPSYMCAPHVAAGRLVRFFPEWRVPSVDVHAVFPSRSASPLVRAFVDFVKSEAEADGAWSQEWMGRFGAAKSSTK